MNLYFATPEGHIWDKQSLKISKSFEDANRAYCVLKICQFAICHFAIFLIYQI